MNVNKIRQIFIEKFNNGEIENNGTLEIIGASFLADEETIFGKADKNYIEAEIKWYLSQSLNINDIYNNKKLPPKAWINAANKNGEINSNYGELVFGWNNYNQFYEVLGKLKDNIYTRRASIIYNRPSIHFDSTAAGKNDFICTNAVTYFYRNDTLNAIVQMRSNDVVFGYKNDYAWQKYILEKLAKELNVKSGNIIWQVQSLHIYPQHFKLIKRKEGDFYEK